MLTKKFAVAVVLALFVVSVSAQLVQKRRPQAQKQEPKQEGQKESAKKQEPATSPVVTTESFSITGEIPATLEAGRRYVFPLNVQGGEPDTTYNWKFDGPENQNYSMGHWFAKDVKSKTVAHFIWWPPTEPGDVEVKITVTKSSDQEPPPTATRTFKVMLTPFKVTLDDLQEHLNVVAKGDDLLRASGTITYWMKKSTELTRERERKVLAELKAAQQRNERLHQKVNWIIKYGGAVMGLLLVALGYLVVQIRRRGKVFEDVSLIPNPERIE